MNAQVPGSFGIDRDELDGLTPQQCFVLGYELAQVDSLLRQPDAFSKPIHSANRERISKRCVAAGRPHFWEWMPDDKSENWLYLKVEAA